MYSRTILKTILLIFLFCFTSLSTLSQPSDNWTPLQLDLGHLPSTGPIAWIPNSDTLAIVTPGGISTHNLETNTPQPVLSFENITRMFHSSDGTRTILGNRLGEIRVYETSTWELLWQHDETGHEVVAMDITPDDNLLAVADLLSIRVFDLGSQSEIITLQTDRSYGTTSLAFFNEGLLFSGGLDGFIHVWDLVNESEYESLRIEQNTGIGNLRIHPESLSLFSAHSGGLTIWDLETRTIRSQLTSNTIPTTQDINQDGSEVVYGDVYGTLQMWDPDTSEVFRTFDGHQMVISDISLNDFTGVIASRDEAGIIKIWDVESSEILATLDLGYVDDFSFSPDGDHVSVGYSDGFLRVWNIETGQTSIELHSEGFFIGDIVYHPDNSWLAMQSYQNNFVVEVWDINTSARVFYLELDEAVTGIEFLSDMTTLLIMTVDELQFWNIVENTLQQKIDVDIPFSRHVFLEDTETIMFSRDVPRRPYSSNIYIFDITTGESTSLVQDIPGSITQLSISLENNTFAFATCFIEVRQSIAERSTIQIRDLTNGEVIEELAGWGAVSLHPLDPIVAYLDHENNVRFYDMSNSQFSQSVISDVSTDTDIEFSSDGSMLAMISSNGTVNIWQQ